MCGRYATTRSAADLSQLFESYDETGGRLDADYNVAPTDPVPIVRMSASAGPTATGNRSDATGEPPVPRRALSVARWGLVPSWAKDARGGARMINARAETVATTNAYARSFARRRCLVPADGWYEWVRGDGGTKQPYFMTPADGGVLALAGLWSVWKGPDGPLLSCSVITTPAVGELADVHDRMPLLLAPERWTDWLDGGDSSTHLLAPPSARMLAGIEIRPVGRGVGDVRNDGPELVARVDAPPLRTGPATSDALTLF
ncbi:SOS response-associated peptidase [Micromonospora sp. NBC_01699]|uniref:SOS response-associated peptidase n=1 Tax=Micromonospora sp. NBC_01699 TaxID=2975984 RepID=UPI002E2DD9A5|nr:SOS response-associated peptidase [Micromonospora sp. NBC_01699]